MGAEFEKRTSLLVVKPVWKRCWALTLPFSPDSVTQRWGGSHGSWPLSPLTESRPRFAKPARMMCSAPGSDSWTPRVRPASGRGRKCLGALKAAGEAVSWAERDTQRQKGVININCNATSWYSLTIYPKDMLSQHQTRCHGRDVKYLETSFNIVACEDPF